MQRATSIAKRSTTAVARSAAPGRQDLLKRIASRLEPHRTSQAQEPTNRRNTGDLGRVADAPACGIVSDGFRQRCPVVTSC